MSKSVFSLLAAFVASVLTAAEPEPSPASWKAKIPAGDQSSGASVGFWFYDDTFVAERRNPHASVSVRCSRDGSRKNDVVFEFRRSLFGWRMLDRSDFTRADHYRFRGDIDAGWTRFDVTRNPEGRVDFWFNGRHFATALGSYVRIEAVSTFRFGSVEDVEVCVTGAKVTRTPVIGFSWRGLTGSAEIDPRLVASRDGRLRFVLRDGRLNEIGSFDCPVLKGGEPMPRIPLRFDNIPRSGSYWLFAEYSEKGLSRPLVSWKRIYVQFANDRLFPSSDWPISLNDSDWEFLPVGPSLPISGSRIPPPTPEAMRIPDHVPQDWTCAYPWHGLWRGYGYELLDNSVHSAWYRKRIALPSQWKGKRVLMRLEDVYTVAVPFVNGRRMGKAVWPAGEVDITEALRFDGRDELAVFVKKDPFVRTAGACREIAGEEFNGTNGFFDRFGLEGKVEVFPVTPGARVEGAAIETQVSRKRWNARCELTSLVRGRTYVLEGEASVAGRVVSRLEPVRFKADREREICVLSAAWSDPVLWEIGRPWLYEFTARLREDDGSTIAPFGPELFGFREVSADGPHLKLNGRVVTLMNALREPVAVPGQFVQTTNMCMTCYNVISGTTAAGLLDEMGLVSKTDYQALEPSLHALVLAQLGKADDPRLMAAIEDELSARIKWMRNHPSNLFRRGPLGGGRNGNGGLYNPYFANGTWVAQYRDNAVRMKGLEIGTKVKEILHRLDPTRPVSAQDAGSVGDIRQITEYPGWRPLQEAIEDGEYWQQVSSKPFLISEQASPFYSNWTDDCQEGKGWNAVPCFQEWASAVVGDSAWPRDEFYDYWLKVCEKDVAAARAKDPSARMKSPPALWQMAYDPPLHCRLARARTVEMALFNRAHGIGMITPGFTAGPEMVPMAREFGAPVTGFLCGPRERITGKDHVFAGGERLRRALCLLNNSWRAEELEWSWSWESGGRRLAGRQGKSVVPAGGKMIVDVACDVPDVSETTETKLCASFVRNGCMLRSDEQTVVVFRRQCRWDGADIKIALIDPDLETARDFRRLGIPFHSTMFDENLSDYDLVVFGRRAFNYEFALLPEGLDIGALAASGPSILILEQEEAVLRNRFKFRTEYISERTVFPRLKGDIFDGVPESALRYWRGTATLTDGYRPAKEQGLPRAGDFGNGGTWQYRWNDGELHPRPMKWGNAHQVCTVAVIKPDLGNFRTLVDCGYAQNYAAAFELDAAFGLVVFSQLDTTARTECDPAADRMLVNLVRHAAKARRTSPRRLSLLGTAADADVLRRMGFENLDTTGDINSANLVVVGRLGSDQLRAQKQRLSDFAKRGGIVFSLAKSAGDLACGWLPFEPTVTESVCGQALPDFRANKRLLAGLGPGDFFWKGNLSVAKLDESIVKVVRFGNGAYVFCQIAPWMFGDTQDRHWLKPSRRVTERMIRTMLTNLGGQSVEPDFVRPARAAGAVLARVDLSGRWNVSRDRSVWRDIDLPGSVQHIYPEWTADKATYWFRRTISMPDVLSSGASVVIRIGNVSGSNRISINGVEVAVTDSDTDVNTVANMSREYVLTGKCFRTGENEVLMRVDVDRYAMLGMRGSNGSVSGEFSLEILDGLESIGNIAEPYFQKAERTDDPYWHHGY